MLLLHVCRIWRGIAVGTPSLWTRMNTRMDSAHSHDMAQAWLTRAKECPLSIRLYRWAVDKEDAEKDVRAISTMSIFQTILVHAHNITSLQLSAVPAKCLHELDQLADSCNFPSLEKLEIGVGKKEANWGPMRDKPCVQLFINAPLLRGVILVGCNASPVFLGSLPWHQLTKYIGTRAYLDDCMDAWRLGLNFVECTLSTD
ncbi:hypothetical protein MSAN_01832400 [Mycena sanguinolenta]|uniref:F-box domain-containing protein n=1 Tax=Mycena sanguinolenta TaxID=230812 RepID=A0A8H7CSQ1_9AGAR|nr:hypothetical protein MSAN_01832400 [Mycena sanguinolenta]